MIFMLRAMLVIACCLGAGCAAPQHVERQLPNTASDGGGGSGGGSGGM